MEKTMCEKLRSTSNQGLLEVDEREGRSRQMRSVHRASVMICPRWACVHQIPILDAIFMGSGLR